MTCCKDSIVRGMSVELKPVSQWDLAHEIMNEPEIHIVHARKGVRQKSEPKFILGIEQMLRDGTHAHILLHI